MTSCLNYRKMKQTELFSLHRPFLKSCSYLSQPAECCSSDYARAKSSCGARGLEHLFEPTHSRLEEFLDRFFKTWTSSNRGDDLPDALTLFFLHFEIERKPCNDFQCLGNLTLGRLLHIICIVRALKGLTSPAVAQTALITPE